MQQRSGARELGLAVACLAALSRFVQGPALPAIAALIVLLAVAGSARLRDPRDRFPGRADRLVLPGLAAFAGVGVARLVEPMPWLAGIFAGTWLAVAWAAAAEAEPILSDGSHARPVAIRLGSLGLSFASFAAIGGLVPRSLPGGGWQPDAATSLAALTLLVATGSLAGCRIAAVAPNGTGSLWKPFVEYALVVAATGSLVWVLGLPRLFGPALLLLAMYIVTALRESDRPLRSNARLVREILALGLVGAAVVGLGLLTRQW
jgi:hypothetical protein